MSLSFSGRLLPLVYSFALSFALAPRAGATALFSPNHVPAAVRFSKPTGRLSPTQRLNLAIGLPLRNQDVLSRFLTDLYDPASPRYHHYLTTGEFTQEFGPSETDYAAVVAFARSNHFTITETHPNRMLVSVNAAVADIENAFHVKLNLYPHPSEARSFYAPDSEPTLNLEVPVLHISGLDNLVIPRPANLTPTPLPPSGEPIPLGGSGPQGTYLGKDFAAAYARGVSLTGAGQMVGLLEFDGFYAADITRYRITAGLPNVPIQTVLMDQMDGSAGTDNTEVALDIEMAISMAPGLAQVIVYEGAIPDTILNRMATDNLAKQLSASWSYPVDALAQQIFKQFAAQGQSFFTASGDGGAYTTGANRPTDDPYVISVGGTTLSTTTTGGPWSSETTWNWTSLNQASGGGISLSTPIPVWQQGIDMTANKGSATLRNSPDVSMVADAVYAVFDNGSSGAVGGTSCSAPLWAAFTALVNQQATSLAQPTVGFLNPAFYALGKSADYTNNFHDVVTGNNTHSGSTTLYYAAPGYDLCTGWGSPIGAALINSLAPRAPSPVITNGTAALLAEGCSQPNGYIDPGETVTVNFNLKNIGGLKTTNLVATLLADDGIIAPGAPQTYGSLAAAGGATSRSFSFTANGACGGTLIAKLALSDGEASLGTAVFTFPLGKPIIASSQNFDSTTPPALPSGWTTSATGGGTRWSSNSGTKDSGANSAFAGEPANPGVSDLLSPAIPITTPNALLSFRNNYNTEIDPIINRAYDGGALEIQIGTNAFSDIIAAGGSFVTGGYTRILDPTNDNPMAGRQVWGGNSGGFMTTSINLPASAAGQAIRLKWRFGTDTGNAEGGFGWYIDTISIADGAACCNPSADLAVNQNASPTPAILGASLDYRITVNNLGPQTAYNVMVTDVLAAGAEFRSAPPGCVYTNGLVICSPGTVASGSSTSFIISVAPSGPDPLTNTVSVTSVTADPAPTNNLASSVTTVSTTSVPLITQQPKDLAVPLGASPAFQVGAEGPPPLEYQWFFNSTNLPGATGSSLTISNVQSRDTGLYFVVIANPSGPITSSIVHLSLLVPTTVTFTNIAVSGGKPSISVPSTLGATYSLEYKNSLGDGAWTPLLPTVPGNGATISLEDTNGFALPSRFYRIRSFPSP